MQINLHLLALIPIFVLQKRHPSYGYTRCDTRPRRAGTGRVRCVRPPEFQGGERIAFGHGRLHPLLARQRRTAAAGTAFGGVERARRRARHRAAHLSGGDARRDHPHRLAHSRRRDRRSGHPPRPRIGQRQMAVAQRRGAGRLSAGAQHGARDAQRAVRPGLPTSSPRSPRSAKASCCKATAPSVWRSRATPTWRSSTRKTASLLGISAGVGALLGRREPRTGRPDAPLRRRAGHGVPDPGRHPRLHARRRDGQAVEQRPARTQDHAAAAAAARPCRRGAARRAARPAGAAAGRGRSTPCNRPSRSREACRRRRK